MKGWNYDFSGVENGLYTVSTLHAMGKKIASSEVLNNALSHGIVAISNGRILTLGDIISFYINPNFSIMRAGGVFSCMRGRLPISCTEYDSPAFFARPPLLGDKDPDSVGLFVVYQDGRRLLKQYYSWRITNGSLERIFRTVGKN